MEDTIIFYTTHCPMCKGLEMLLKSKEVQYQECEDIELMRSKGLTHAPALEVNGEMMDFAKAMRWLKERS